MAVVVAVLLMAPSSGSAEEGAAAYSHAPSDVVVRYVEIPGELAEADRPTLTIRGDGRASAHYPAYMRRAGDYTTTLARADVDALVGSLVAKGVTRFDAAAVRQVVRAVETARAAALSTGDGGGVLTVVTDPSITIIELSVAPEAPAGATVLPAVATHRAEWHGLRRDALQHPSVEALGGLLEARSELRAIMDHVHATAPR